MKPKFLQLTNPCTENWQHMTPNAKGHFCSQCAKTVIDFTKLSQTEISRLMKNSKGGICARATTTQLMQPLFDAREASRLELPYSGIAAGFMIATALVAVQPAQAQATAEKTAWVRTTNTKIPSVQDRRSDPKTTPSNDFVTLKGMVTTETDHKPIANAQIMWVTLTKQLVAHTNSDGTFSIEIPFDLVDDDNVIRVSYERVAKTESQDAARYFDGYETKDYVLTRADLNTQYAIQATERMLVMGAMSLYSGDYKPVVFVNGKEVNYKEFAKAQNGQRNTIDLSNKTTMYFWGETARAIYGRPAKNGLYIVSDTTGDSGE